MGNSILKHMKFTAFLLIILGFVCVNAADEFRMLTDEAVKKQLEKAGFKKSGKDLSQTVTDAKGNTVTKKCKGSKCQLCKTKKGGKEKCTKIDKSNMQKFKDGMKSAYDKTKKAAKKAWEATKSAVKKAVKKVKTWFSGAEMGMAIAGIAVTSALVF